MQYKIVIGHPLTAIQTNEISQLIHATFEEINQSGNKWNPKSELSRLNQLKAHVKQELSPLLYRLVLETDLVVRLSQGRFDPTIEPLQQLWKKNLEQEKTPTSEEIAQIAPSIGWQQIHFEGGLFYKDNDAIALDLGGIAKGLCIDLLCERLRALGYTRIYVEWGGEIRTLGQHPDNRPWRVYVTQLGNENPANALKIYELSDQAIATSGDYLQNWPLPGKETTYFHIFDPKTLQPLESTYNSIASATVVADSCAFADGLATAAMLFPTIEEAENWARQIQKQFPEVEFFFYSREREAIHSAFSFGCLKRQ